MNKSIWIRIIALILVFALTGCSTSTMAPVDTQPSESTITPVQKETLSTEPEETTEPTAVPTEPPTEPPKEELSAEQKNAIAMLNYLALTTEEIHITKNNRLLLEEIYTSLLNEINPGSIDNITQDHLNNVRDVIKEFLNIEAKREQLLYIYNREKASAMKAAVPNPLAVLSVTNSLDWKRLVTGVAFTVIDSYNNYKSANDNAEHEYFLSGWELDQEESNVILRNRDYTFNYMTDIVQEYGSEENKVKLGKLTLNEKAIENFAEICAIDEVHRKIERLTYVEETYKLFGNYWLELADCYYTTGEYEQCLACIAKYYELDISIFRQDFNIVPILPKAIVAAQAVYTGNEYVTNVQAFADAIVDNASPDEWAVRYFAAQTYMDLYAKTENRAYLEKAYEIIKHNVTELIEEQISLNTTYLQDVQKVTLSNKQAKLLSEEEKKQEQTRIDAYNKALEDNRKLELPPIYEPLALNCELLFALAEELDIDATEKEKIHNILQIDASGIFLCVPLTNRYSFKNIASTYSIELTKDQITIPANLLLQGASISVTVKHGGESTVLDDWTVSSVERTGKTVNSFNAYYTSKQMSEFKWSSDAQITIKISYGNYCDPITFNFKVKEYKDNWIFPDTVTFEKV